MPGTLTSELPLPYGGGGRIRTGVTWLAPGVGLEPTSSFERLINSQVRLPISPPRNVSTPTGNRTPFFRLRAGCIAINALEAGT